VANVRFEIVQIVGHVRSTITLQAHPMLLNPLVQRRKTNTQIR
jgi:hypothetical protein